MMKKQQEVNGGRRRERRKDKDNRADEKVKLRKGTSREKKTK